MKIRKSPLFALLATALLSGCAAARHYQAAPLVPAQTAAQLENRSLRDPGLRQFLEESLGRTVSWPAGEWDLQSLTLAALYFSPQMEIARDRIAVAQGAIVTAGEHPNPSISLTPGVPSPYLFDLPFTFPIETHGKRALRIEQAKQLSSAARISLAETAWQVSINLRNALLAYRMAQANLALSNATERIEAQRVHLLNQRLTAGEGARPALETAQVVLSNVRFTISVNEGRVATTRAALAAAIGVPVAALDGLRFNWPGFQSLPAVASLSPQRIERDAVLNRLDVRRALDQYAAADAALRVQIARQYPNFDIGPGYTFEGGDNFFRIPFSMILPIRNRNQGPIAQAEALRKEAAANFRAVQARAIAKSQQALAAYRSALAELDQANRPIQEQNRQVQMTQRAVAAGEADRLQLNTLLLEGTVYTHQRLQALSQAQTALGDLENAVERPLVPGELPPAAVSVPSASTQGKSRP